MKKKVTKFIFSSFTLCFITSLFSQEYSIQSFLKAVKDNHPIAKIANAQIELGDARILSSKGGFDPKLQATLNEKFYKKSTYYNEINAEIKVPTWLGIEAVGGFENNRGNSVNPSDVTEAGGLWYMGVSLPILKGLLIDKRRYELRKAQIFANSTVLTRREILNDLFLDAALQYWDWFTAYNKLTILNQGLTVATERKKAIARLSILGDRAAIDSIEAGILVQNLQLDVNQANLDYTNHTFLLSVFLWDDNKNPIELQPTIIPPNYETLNGILPPDSLVNSYNTILQNHPEIILQQLKLSQLNLDLRLNKEQLKPTVNLNYAMLGSNSLNFNTQNYKGGVAFQIPIFLRMERGMLKANKIGIQNETYSLQLKQLAIQNKVKQSLNSWQISYNQVELYKKTVNDYKTMLNAEQINFNNGESSLFLINTRQMALIGAQNKFIELVSKNQFNKFKTNYTLGIIAN